MDGGERVLTPTTDPVVEATEALRRYLAIARQNGWSDSVVAIVKVIEVVESRTF